MGSCWSSPPVVEQEVELPDLENQLSAPKPRPTAATSWTHKPAILIPATLVCLILSGFALSIFVGYNSMSETKISIPPVNIPNGTQPLESDSSSNILSPPKSAGTTSVETDKSSTVQNPANSATKTLGKSTSKIIVEDETIPIVKVEDQAKPIETAQTGGANLPSGQVYHPTSLTLKNQTSPHANTIPPTFDNVPPTGLHSQATEHENADTNSESELQVDRPTSVIPDSQTSPIPPSAGHQTQEIDQQTYDTDLTSNLAIPGSSPISIPSGNTTPIDPQPLNSGFVSKSPTTNTFGEEHQDTSSMKVKRGDSVDLSSDHPVNPDLDKPNFSMTPAPHNTSGKTNPIIPEPVESDDSQIQAPPNPISGTPGNSNSAKSAAKPLDTPPIEDQAKPIETAQTGGANLPSEQVYLPNSLNLKNKTPSDANTIPPPFDNTIATGLQSQATDHQNADTNPESEPQVDESQTSDNTPSSDHQSQEIEHENADTAQISKLMIINRQTSTGSNTVPPPSDDAPPTGPQSPAIGHQNSDTNSEFEPQVDEYQTSENTPSSDHKSQEIEHENADTAQMSKLMILNPQTSTGSKTIPRPSDSITLTDPEQHKSGFVPIPNTPVKVKPEHVDLGSQTKTPLTSISSAPGNSSFKTNEDKIVPIQSDNTPIIKTSPESEPTPLTDLIRVPSAPKPATVEIVIQFTADGSITWTDPENKEEEMEDFEDVLGYIVKKVIAPTFMEREITDHEFLNKINTDRLKSYNKRKAKLFRSTSKKEIRITTFVPKDITFGEAEMRVYLAPNLMTNSYESPNYANLDDDLTKTREDIKTKLSTLFRINATVTVSKFNEAGKPILPIISSTTDKSNSAMSSSETLNTSTLNISKSDNSPAPKPSTVEIVIKFTDDG
eukprot:441357_1